LKLIWSFTGEAVILEREIISVDKPSRRTLEAFRNVFNNVGNGEKKPIPALGGRSQTILEDEDDLMSLQITSDDDRLTRFLQRYCPVFFVVRISSSARSFWPLN
jgi:hypothetical protein